MLSGGASADVACPQKVRSACVPHKRPRFLECLAQEPGRASKDDLHPSEDGEALSRISDKVLSTVCGAIAEDRRSSSRPFNRFIAQTICRHHKHVALHSDQRKIAHNLSLSQLRRQRRDGPKEFFVLPNFPSCIFVPISLAEGVCFGSAWSAPSPSRRIRQISKSQMIRATSSNASAKAP